MRCIIALCFFMVSSVLARSQYRFDNKNFKTVYLEDLCKTLQNNSDFILLDVRSKGEHHDTSTSLHLNIGHLKNAINIDIGELPTRLNELSAYKDKPIFVYCSHSQRSRRASKLLGDSGYAKVFNINGGLTGFHTFGVGDTDCSGVVMETNVPYTLLSPKEVTEKVTTGAAYYILDIRRDSVFQGIATDERKSAMGKLKGATNIPFYKLKESISSLPRDRTILIVDDNGNESPKAAQLLLEKGYKNIAVLFNGMDAWAQYEIDRSGKPAITWEPSATYTLLSGESFDDLLRKKSGITIIDIRTNEEFNNQSKDSWHNIGNLKNAINIPFVDLQQKSIPSTISKNSPVVVYSFSAGTDVFQAAKLLSDQGYKNVNVLMGGLFNLRWKAANLKGKEQLKDWVVNIPAENQ